MFTNTYLSATFLYVFFSPFNWHMLALLCAFKSLLLTDWGFLLLLHWERLLCLLPEALLHRLNSASLCCFHVSGHESDPIVIFTGRWPLFRYTQMWVEATVPVKKQFVFLAKCVAIELLTKLDISIFNVYSGWTLLLYKMCFLLTTDWNHGMSITHTGVCPYWIHCYSRRWW